MRGADPVIVLVPGVGMFSFGADAPGGADRRRVLRQRHQRDARRRGALDLPADRRVREVPHRVLGARGGEAAPAAAAQAARRSGCVRHRRRVGHRPGHRRPPRSRGRRGRRSPTATSPGAQAAAEELGGPDVAAAVEVDVSDEAAVAAAVREAAATLRGRRPGGQQRRPVDLQAAGRDDHPPTGICSTG